MSADPSQVFTADYGVEECAALYAIESDTGDCGWVLETRHDEHGRSERADHQVVEPRLLGDRVGGKLCHDCLS